MTLSTSEIFAHLSQPRWRIAGDFRGKDLISVEQLDPESIRRVMVEADMLERLTHDQRIATLHGRSIAVMFYQPSTRTYTSFMRAGQSLGADVVGIHGMMQYSSAYKGETLADTVRTIEALQHDAIVLRHFDDDSALIAASNVDIPVINAGSGKLEHPTQALLDVRTIIKETKTDRPEKLHIAFIGDLKYGRTVHSLAKLMATLGAGEMSFVSPEVLAMPSNLMQQLTDKGVTIHQTDSLDEVIAHSDVLYVTRVQREWFDSEEAYDAVRSSQRITTEVLEKAKPTAVLMHPLPRVDEITPEVDNDPRAAYFRQVGHGLWVRMALLKLILRG